MSTNHEVVIIGAGAWGTTLALVALRAGSRVRLVAHRREMADYMREHRQHPVSLPGVHLPDAIEVMTDRDIEVLPSTSIVVIAISVQHLREALSAWTSRLASARLLSVAKGIDTRTLQRPSELIVTALGRPGRLAALSGPNLASEIAAGKPAASVIAAADAGLAGELVPAFHSDSFRVYRGTDMIGLELGGALKNVIAIGAGMAQGLGAGDNATASFITRGLAEITRIGVASGASASTFAGISGVGDLIATCASPLSRNHRVGIGLARGQSLETILHVMGETAEGVPTTAAALRLARSLGMQAPITEQMHRVLFEDLPVDTAIQELLSRPAVEE
jgi:glycerol-3-phosphate dehydrogenase (NAD(P)+)